MSASPVSVPVAGGSLTQTGATSPTPARTRPSKRGIEDRLRGTILKDVEKEIISVEEVTKAWLKYLDAKFGLREKYGVTESGLRGLVLRVRMRRERELNERRGRQLSAMELIKALLGQNGEKDAPQILGHHAYLAIVASLFERLTNHKDITTEELAALSRMLAEQRRAQAQSSRAGCVAEAPAAGVGGEAQEDIGESVKRVYGTNFREPSERGHRQEPLGNIQ